jgi:hypothetical protein
MRSRHSLFALALPALVSLFVAAPAQAISKAKIVRARLIIPDSADPSGWRSVGRVGTHVNAFRKAGHACEISTYEYGGMIACVARASSVTREGQRVLIGLENAGRYNESEVEGEIRPDGPESKALQGSEAAAFLNVFAQVKRTSR